MIHWQMCFSLVRITVERQNIMSITEGFQVLVAGQPVRCTAPANSKNAHKGRFLLETRLSGFPLALARYPAPGWGPLGRRAAPPKGGSG